MDVPRGRSVGGGPGASHTLTSLHSQRGRCQTSHLIRDSRVKPTGPSLSRCQLNKPGTDGTLVCYPLFHSSLLNGAQRQETQSDRDNGETTGERNKQRSAFHHSKSTTSVVCFNCTTSVIVPTFTKIKSHCRCQLPAMALTVVYFYRCMSAVCDYCWFHELLCVEMVQFPFQWH